MIRLKLITLLLFSVLLTQAQDISPVLFGQNAWMPSWFFNGQLDNIWQHAAPGNFELIRIGGIEYEDNFEDHIDDYIRFVDSIRITCNAEPIFQLPRGYSRQQTLDLFDYVNVTKAKNIKYWSIGNEPDSHNPNELQEISAFFIRIAKALKDRDHSLKVIGPDYANYWVHPDDPYDAGQTVYSDFIASVGLEMNTNNTAYLLDVFAFHNYVGYTIDEVNDNQDLSRVVEKINGTLSVINGQRTQGIANKANWGIGEFNISSVGGARYEKWSFYAGQYFAMVFDLGMREGAEFICPWSLIEGQWRQASDLSMFEDSNNGFTPRSTFYHTQLLTIHRRTAYMESTSSDNRVRTIGMKDETGFTLMVLNTDENEAYDLDIRMNYSSNTSTETLIQLDAGLPNEHQEEIPANATMVFVFQPDGQLLKKYVYTKTDADQFNPPLVIDIVTSTADMIAGNKFSIYPNPSMGIINVDLEKGAGEADYSLYNSFGELVKNGRSHDRKIDFTNVSTGFYMLQLRNQGQVLTSKIQLN